MTDRHAENYNAEVGNLDFAWGMTLGTAYLYPLGVRSHISNPFWALVNLKGGVPIHPHARVE